MKLEEQQILIEEEDTFNYLALLLSMLNYWYLFAISITFSVIGAYLYTKYSSSVYEVNTTLMVENESPSFSTERVLEDLDLFSQKKNILNEKVLIQSYSTIKETLNELDFTISYKGNEGYSNIELYINSPFIVVIDTLTLQPIGVDFQLKFISENEFNLHCSAEDAVLYSFKNNEASRRAKSLNFNGNFKYGERILSENFSFKIIKNPEFNEQVLDYDYYIFNINTINSLTLEYKEVLKIDLLEKGVDVLVISLQGENVAKSVDFLNKLTTVYIKKKLAKKNIIANNTILFIDNQLIAITDSLLQAENKLQNYRSNSKIIDMSFQTQKLFDMIATHEQDKAILIAQQKYYNYLLQSLNKSISFDDLIIPSTMGVSDENLNKLVIELTELTAKRMILLSNTSEKSVALLNVENKINNTKKLILNNLHSIIDASKISLETINNQIYKLEIEAKKLPKAQQKLFGFERKYTLSSEIYNFLMQKRAEAQIAKASNTADSEVIDIARYDVFEKKSAKYRQIYLIAILVGLIIPGIGIFLIEILRNRIVVRKDIENITDTPIVGSIIQDKKQITKVFVEFPKSTIAESFRSFYANLQYFTKGKQNQVILISSSMPKEGKTFNSINLALVFASFGKKTCLLSFDLRLPKVHYAFNIKNDIGLSTFLINVSTQEEIIHPTEIENLFVIPSGPVPPNPVELIASKNTLKLFQYLKSKFDIVIVDSPPIGVVADGLMLTQHSDINVHLVRQNYTKKKALKSVIKELENNEIGNRTILFNGIKQSRLYGYGGYSYDYGYGYFNEEKKSWWKRIVNKNNKQI